jgi:enoyl-CoA hydratase/carnithine racemase
MRDEGPGWDIMREEFQKIAGGPDALEGARAFTEKRPPRWTDDG